MANAISLWPRFLINKASGIGSSNKISIGCSPIMNCCGILYRTGPLSLSLHLQSLYYNTPKKNISTYYGSGVFCYGALGGPGPILRYYSMPGLSVTYGKEFNRETSSPYFIEGGVNIAKIFGGNPMTQRSAYLYPNVKCGFAF